MSFGLSNAPATFQGLINRILAEKLDVFCIVYLDDILIYTEEAGSAHVDAVTITSPQGIRMEEERIASVHNWLRPQYVCDVHVFIRVAAFYRRSIKGFSKVARA